MALGEMNGPNQMIGEKTQLLRGICNSEIEGGRVRATRTICNWETSTHPVNNDQGKEKIPRKKKRM